MRLLNTFASMFSYRVHRSIKTLSVHSWNMIHETGDLDYLFRHDEEHEGERISFNGFHWFGLRKLSIKIHRAKLVKTWALIYNEYLERFGLDESYLRYMKQRKTIALMQADRIINGDRFLDTMIAVHKTGLSEFDGIDKSYNFMDTVVIIEKHFNKDVDTLKTTVEKFFTYIKHIKDNG